MYIVKNDEEKTELIATTHRIKRTVKTLIRTKRNNSLEKRGLIGAFKIMAAREIEVSLILKCACYKATNARVRDQNFGVECLFFRVTDYYLISIFFFYTLPMWK